MLRIGKKYKVDKKETNKGVRETRSKKVLDKWKRSTLILIYSIMEIYTS